MYFSVQHERWHPPALHSKEVSTLWDTRERTAVLQLLRVLTASITQHSVRFIRPALFLITSASRGVLANARQGALECKQLKMSRMASNSSARVWIPKQRFKATSNLQANPRAARSCQQRCASVCTDLRLRRPACNIAMLRLQQRAISAALPPLCDMATTTQRSHSLTCIVIACAAQPSHRQARC